jgi:hypothetical protein
MKFSDFMPEYGPNVETQPKETDAAEFIAKVKAMNARMGGRVTKRRGDPS